MTLRSVHTCQCFSQLSLSYTLYTFCFQAKWHPALTSSPTLFSTYVVSINIWRCHQTSQLFIPTLFNLCIQVCFNCFCSLMFSKVFCIVLFCGYVGYLMVFVFPMFYYCICCIFLGLYKVGLFVFSVWERDALNSTAVTGKLWLWLWQHPQRQFRFDPSGVLLLWRWNAIT